MTAAIDNDQFGRLSSFISAELGIKMPESKKTMLAGRLSKRLRALRFDGFGQYCDYLFGPEGRTEELVHLINAVTTNKTDFFREPAHFDYLTSTVVPELQGRLAEEGRRTLSLWSAGCSTGEEPYTLAMILAEYAARHGGMPFEILATDISQRVLEAARRAIYPRERVAAVEQRYRHRYLLRGKGSRAAEVRIVPELRRLVRFGRLNFMDETFNLPNRVDIIFCRNVIIYFDKATQQRLMHKFARCMNRQGFLFLGHSETLHGYDTPFRQVAPTVYRYNG